MLIPLTQGQYAIVDDESFPLINKYKYHTNRDSQGKYVVQRNQKIKGKVFSTSMARDILEHRRGEKTRITFKDGNPLNNRVANLNVVYLKTKKKE